MAKVSGIKGSGATAGFDSPGKSKGGSSKTGTSVLTGGSHTSGVGASGKTPKTNQHGPDLVGTMEKGRGTL